LFFLGRKWDVDKFGSNKEPFLMTGDRDFVHDLILVQWDVTDDIRSPLSLALPSGGLGVAVVSKCEDHRGK
jgi:hypothetical protein